MGKLFAENHDVSVAPQQFVAKKTFLPTIETCFNCFGIHSSDAKEIIKRRQNRPGNSKVTQPLSTQPPSSLAGKGESTKWRQCLKEKFFLIGILADFTSVLAEISH